MHGASYLGATQWLAAMAAPPGLRAIVPNVTSADYHEGWTYQGGAFQLGFMLRWGYADWLSGIPRLGRSTRRRAHGCSRRVRSREPPPAPRRSPTAGPVAPFYRAWLTRPNRDDWWRSISPREHWGQISVPALNIGGWYDIFVAGTIDNFVGMRAHAATPGARASQRLIIGPWSHRTIQATGEFADRRYGVRATVGVPDLAGEHIRWFDRWLRDGVEPGRRGRPYASS